jgi:small GTP-binding protein
MESNDSNENTAEFNVKKKNIILDTSEYNITPIKDTGELDEVMKEITYKIIIIGDQGVGKSTIIQNLTEKGEKQSDQYRATIGFDIFHYSCKVKDKIIKLQIWDTCGLEEFHSLTPNLYKNALLVIIVYSIPNRNTFEDVEKWINILKKNSQPETLVFIVGNKKDLENERDVTEDEGKKYVEDNNLNFFIETSAKSGAFVDKLFEQAFAQLYEYKKSYENDKDNDEDRIDFSRRKGTFKVKSYTKKVNQKGKHCC